MKNKLQYFILTDNSSSQEKGQIIIKWKQNHDNRWEKQPDIMFYISNLWREVN